MIGGLLNATLGNLTELLIALAALRAGQYVLVKASIAGAIVTNALFMLGASFLLGGLKHHVQEFNRNNARVQAGLLFLATVALLVPSVVADADATVTTAKGENPHQKAALYVDATRPAGLAQAEQLQGKEMSYNNYVDADAAWRSANDFTDPCVSIIKHANPCGIAIGADIAEAHRKAHACDPVSAYGGVVAANQRVTEALATQLADVFTEVIVAPGYEPGALELFAKKKNLRVLVAPSWRPETVEQRQISGGTLVQTADRVNEPEDDARTWTLVAGSDADDETLRDLQFAWRAVRSVKSNAILLASGGAAVGVGMGQVNRVDSVRLAVSRAGADRAKGSVARERRVLPVRRRTGAADRGRYQGDRRAGWLDPRRGRDRRLREGRRDALLHRDPALLPLAGAAPSTPAVTSCQSARSSARLRAAPGHQPDSASD